MLLHSSCQQDGGSEGNLSLMLALLHRILSSFPTSEVETGTREKSGIEWWHLGAVSAITQRMSVLA